MGSEIADELALQWARLQIGFGADDERAVFGDPPWLYPIDFVLRVARGVPDGAGRDVLRQALQTAAMTTIGGAPPRDPAS